MSSSSLSQREQALSEDERAGLELIREKGGIHQSEFWKALDVSSRKGSRIVDTLIEHELIDRYETVYEGHRTYFLRPTARELDFSLLMAGDQLSPFIGDESVDATSDEFSQWVMSLAYQ